MSSQVVPALPSTPKSPSDRPTTSRTFSDSDSLHLSATHCTTSTSSTEEDVISPNPAISVLSAVTRHARKTCKQLVKVPSISSMRASSRNGKAPDIRKMKVVTPVYDHVLERWVWPDAIFAEDLEYERRRYSETRSLDGERGRDIRSRDGSRTSTLSLSSSDGSTSSKGSITSRRSRY